jgi:hypothetical protein
MTATITELPRYSPRDLATIDILIKAGEVALALGGTGEPIRHRLSYYYRCRCPLCDGPMRIADGIEMGVDIDCQRGCDPEAVAADLIKRGLFSCRDASRGT